MPGDAEEYKGFVINWDVAQMADTGLWKVKAAVVTPPDESGISSVHPVPGTEDRFTTEEEARQCLMRNARDWIDRVTASA